MFLRQGDLDGACGLYSLIMLLIIHKKIDLEDLTWKIYDDDPPCIVRLKKLLLFSIKGIRTYGISLSDLQGLLLKIFDDSINVDRFYDSLFGGDDKILHYVIRTQLDRGHPVLLSYRRERGGHIVVAIGYTMLEGIMRLYCLDPSRKASWCNFWNNIIDVKIYSSSKDFPDYDHGDGINVKVDGILIIEDEKCVEISSLFNDTPLPF